MELVEIKILGRGGQGGKSIGEILAKTALDEGKYVQAFPEYGAERKGAPVKSFVRISDEQILIHTDIEFPDIIIIIDDTLLKNPALIGSLNEGCRVIINTRSSVEDVKKMLDFKGMAYALDANKIALEELGDARHSNTVMLGAAVKINQDVFSLDIVKKEIRKKFLRKIGEELVQKNINALERGFKEVS